MSKTTTSTDVVAWIDVETTGLDASNDHLLQVACLMTDTKFNVLDETGYEAVIQYPQDVVDNFKLGIEPDAFNGIDPYVVNMHSRSGLWDRLPDGVHVKKADHDLLAYIQTFAPLWRSARIAGNSVRLDLNFLAEYLPATSKHLHYRFIDVTTLQTVASWHGGVPEFEKQLAHEAMADIRESIAQARWLQDQTTYQPFASCSARQPNIHKGG
jgi:oligoribonuclease